MACVPQCLKRRNRWLAFADGFRLCPLRFGYFGVITVQKKQHLKAIESLIEDANVPASKAKYAAVTFADSANIFDLKAVYLGAAL